MNKRRGGMLELRRHVLWLLATLTVVGCSSTPVPEFENRKPTHAVKGKVEVSGKPASGAFILLVPRNEPAENPDPRPRATVQPDGTFTVSTYGDNDGAPAGEYTVAVTWEDPESKSDRFNGRYGPGASKLSASVKEGPNELPPIQLK